MKILYYYWGEITAGDCQEWMRKLGCQVDVIQYHFEDYDHDDKFMEQIKNVLVQGQYDAIFSFDYFPVLSRCADVYRLRYLTWVYDSVNLTLYSTTLHNACNAVYDFDNVDVQEFQRNGFANIHHLPLAYNHTRIEEQLSEVWKQKNRQYEHEVSYLGTFYQDEYNFLDQIAYLPEQLKGYIDGLIESQLLLYGIDLTDEIFTKEQCEEMMQYAKFDMGPNYTGYHEDVIRHMIRKKITVVERHRLMKMVGERFTLDLYSPNMPEDIHARDCGYAEYREVMPRIFATSKINLNVTLRSIRAGIPLRVIDILGAGGFVLTNYQTELEQYFENGVDLVWYVDANDMMNKIAYYLEHDEEREQIASNGRRKAEQLFTYEKLLGTILASVPNRDMI